jgi:16S rRNA (guanine527-N7)-methyltransferase
MTSQEQNFLNSLGNLPFFNSEQLTEVFSRFNIYARCLVEANKKINLISNNDLKKLWERHFLDSIQPLFLFSKLFNYSDSNLRLIDIGSGAGLPGLPIKIILENASMVLVDSIGKKCQFIDGVINKLGLLDCSVICRRVEDLATESVHRERYDIAFSRAIAKTVTALEFVLPFVKVGGGAYFWGSGSEWEDLERVREAAKVLGGRLVEEKKYYLASGGGNDAERKIIYFKKEGLTRRQYPRLRASKHPLP